jgi:hypothetical protein
MFQSIAALLFNEDDNHTQHIISKGDWFSQFLTEKIVAHHHDVHQTSHYMFISLIKN